MEIGKEEEDTVVVEPVDDPMPQEEPIEPQPAHHPEPKREPEPSSGAQRIRDRGTHP